MPDPIQDLQKFGNGGIVTTPLDPSRVRSLGDRRRTRRHAGIAAAAAAVMAAVIVPVAVLNHDDGGRTAPPVTSTPSPAPTPKVVTYPEPGVEVVTPADTAKLDGTTPEFKTFIGQVAEQQAVDGASCPGAFHGVVVQKYSSDGYAIGGVNSCGGYIALWVDGDTGWQEVFGGNDTYDCAELRYYAIPESFAGGCYDYKGDFGPTVVGGSGEQTFKLRLGMDLNQLLAAGGPTIHPVAGDGCATLTYLHEPKIKNQTDGYLSPNGGLVALFARPGMKTPQAIGLGSTLAEVRAAYPDARQAQNGYWVVPIGATDEYEFGIDESGNVGELVLTRSTQDCFA